MKLLQIVTSMNPKSGGPSQGIRNLNSIFPKLDLQVDILTFDNEVSSVEELNSYQLINLGYGITSFQYHKKLKKWLIKNLTNYDFVSVHGIWQYHNVAVYQAMKYLKKNKSNKIPKVIIMPHGMLDPYFQKAQDRKFKALRNTIVWKLTERKAINAADAIFFTCQEELNLANYTFKDYYPKKVINVGYGIEHPPEYIDQMKLAFEMKCPSVKNKKYWLFISRIHPKKGIKELIEVYKHLCKTNNDLPDLVLAGPTENTFAKEMIQLADNNSAIHFPDMLTGDAKWGAFYGSELFILPSYQENFGIAIVEAMACFKPVLITKQVNIWKEIEDGDCGWIIEKTSANLIESKLIEILNTTTTEIQLKSEKSYSTFKDKFDVSNCAINFVNALKSL